MSVNDDGGHGMQNQANMMNMAQFNHQMNMQHIQNSTDGLKALNNQ